MANGDYDNTDDQTGGEEALAQADPQDVDAHRGLLSQILGHLGGQGTDVGSLLGQAGVGTTDPNQMSHGDLVSSTLALAQQHPEVMQMVASRFPQAQGLLGSILGGGGSAAGGQEAGAGGAGGFLSGILGKL